MVKSIKKRDGRIVKFNPRKIYEAIERCVGTDVDTENGIDSGIDIETLTQGIVEVVSFMYGGKRPTVENIQDIVEDALVDSGHYDIARKYVLYRQERTVEREKNTKLMKILGSVFSSKDSDLKRDNANTNMDSPMGVMLKVGSEASKEFYLKNVIKEEYADAHQEGLIHIHK